MNNIVNIAIQILPKADNKDVYGIIDKAIGVIQNSGLPYVVCPFETVIEGTYEEVMNVIKDAQEVCFNNGATELLVNIKIQRALNKDVFIDDKIGKYK